MAAAKPDPKTKAPAPAKGAETPPAPAPKRRGKLVWIILALALAGGGGAAYYFMHDADSTEARVSPSKPPIFVPLESFVVNLQPQDGQHNYMQVGITLKVADQGTADLIKQRMPEIRNRILLLISSKQSTELIIITGKQKLSEEILAATNAVIA